MSLYCRALAILFIPLIFIQGCESPRAKSQLTVIAASSLTDVLQVLKEEFEKNNPQAEVRLIFGGSQILRFQIEQGAAADLFISAHPEHVSSLLDQGLMKSPEPVAENPLVVMVAPQLVNQITQFENIVEVESIVVGDENVPLGTYTEEVLDKAAEVFGQSFSDQLRSSIVSKESNSRLVRSKILLGEADAAIVYESDAILTEAGVIRLPEVLATKARYTLAESVEPRSLVVNDFRKFLSSERARSVFTEFAMPVVSEKQGSADE